MREGWAESEIERERGIEKEDEREDTEWKDSDSGIVRHKQRERHIERDIDGSRERELN